jgi:hypothetical protein
MPAKLSVIAGFSEGTSYWIEDPVVRIGSDPECDLCLPSSDLAGHALTLEYRDGDYFLHNKSAGSIVVSGKPLPSGNTAKWREGRKVELPGNTVLVLDIDGDPAPSSQPEAPAVFDYSTDEYVDDEEDTRKDSPVDETSSGVKPATVIQLAVIAACVLGGISLIVMKPVVDRYSTAEEDVPDYEAVIREATSEDGEKLNPYMYELLTFAESRLGKNDEEARKTFCRLRDELTSRENTDEAGLSPLEETVLRYVLHRLGELEE